MHLGLNNIKYKGQFILFYSLFFMFALYLLGMAVNTGLLVSYKIRLQSAVDASSNAAASTMAYFMANDAPGLDSIAELNEEIMRNYQSFIHDITLVHCSTAVGTPGINCPRIPSIPTCDAQSSTPAGYFARLSINNSKDKYYGGAAGKIIVLQQRLNYLKNLAVRNSIEIAIKTLKSNIPNLSLNEIIVKLSDLQVIEEKRSVVGSFRSAGYASGGCYVNDVENYPISSQLVRRLFLDQTQGNGYAIVGIIKKGTNVKSQSGVGKSISYLPMVKLVGKTESPMFQAFSASAPIRNIQTVYSTYFPDENNRERGLLSTIQNRDASGYQVILNQVSAALDFSYPSNNVTIDPLFESSFPFKVRFIPLAGDTFLRNETNTTEDYYGTGNPIKGNLSQSIFSPIKDYALLYKTYQKEWQYITQGGRNVFTAYESIRH